MKKDSIQMAKELCDFVGDHIAEDQEARHQIYIWINQIREKAAKEALEELTVKIGHLTNHKYNTFTN